MWLISLRDLQWRKRRFIIAILGTALVFAMTLVLAGLSASFRSEAKRTIAASGADGWVVPNTAHGPFTSFGSFPASLAARIETIPGVAHASPVTFFQQNARTPAFQQVLASGFTLGGVGQPRVVEGRAPRRSGEAIVDRALGVPLGGSFVMSARTFRVVGRTTGLSAFAGLPMAYIPIRDAQAIGFGGRGFATAILIRGSIPPSSALPRGFRSMTNAEARDDLSFPLRKPISAIDMVQMLLWLVAIMIIGSVVYLSALERVRDFAVLKATGSGSLELLGGLAIEAGIVALVAGAIAVLIAQLLAPAFPMQVEIPFRSLAILPAIAVVVGLLASLAGLRRAVTVDPALAFGGP